MSAENFANPAASDVSDEAYDAARAHRRVVGRRRVLLGAVLVVLAALAAQAIGPWILPADIVEGPLVQQSTETSAIVVWYTSKPAGCTFTYAGPDGAPHSSAVQASDTRNWVTLSDLKPAQEWSYEIHRDKAVLAKAKLRTNKPAGSPFHFAVLGDSGRGNRAQYTIGTRMAALKPDFVLHTGDLVYSAGERRYYAKRFFEPYKALLQEVTFWPSLGNHDMAKETLGEPYRGVFALPENGPADQTPENAYWFDYADARIAIIDSTVDGDKLARSTAPWLRQVMTGRPATWKFAVFHHPPYTAGKHKPNVAVQQALVPVFEETGVDIVFCGHDHLYERTHPMRGGEVVEGGPSVVYIVSGAGGADLYEQKPELPAYIAKAVDDEHSFTHVTIDGRTLHLEQISVDGKKLDDWTLTKPAATP